MTENDLKEFAITFGTKFADEPHPLFSLAHPQGYVVILAKDDDDARFIAYSQLGLQWAFIYEMDSPQWAEFSPLFPRGELARWAVTTIPS